MDEVQWLDGWWIWFNGWIGATAAGRGATKREKESKRIRKLLYEISISATPELPPTPRRRRSLPSNEKTSGLCTWNLISRGKWANRSCVFVSDQFTHIKGFRQPNKPLPATRATVVVAPQKGENNLAEAFACTLEKPRGSSYCGSQLFFFSCPQLGFLSAWEEGGSSRSYRCRQPKIKYISRAV